MSWLHHCHSYSRYNGDEAKPSKEWAIFLFDSESGAFSDRDKAEREKLRRLETHIQRGERGIDIAGLSIYMRGLALHVIMILETQMLDTVYDGG